MRWLSTLPKHFTLAAMVGAIGLCLSAVGCAEETFKCCECTFMCSDAAGTPVPFRACDCPDGGYTYGECGVWCKRQIIEAAPDGTRPIDLIAGINNPPYSACGAEPTLTLAKNSCGSVGAPAGE